MLRSLLLLTAAPLVGGCLADKNSDASMVVLGDTALASTATDCSFTGVQGQPFLSHGMINIYSPGGYLFAPLVASKISAMSGPEVLQRTITVEGADVSLSVPTATTSTGVGAPTPVTITLTGADQAFRALASASIAPNGGTANIPMELIPGSTLASILTQANPSASDSFNAEVVASAKIFGTMGGDRVESLPFQFAVTVCNQCIINVVGTCPVTIQPRKGDVCNLYQDQPVDCCTEPTTNQLVCPARTS